MHLSMMLVATATLVYGYDSRQYLPRGLHPLDAAIAQLQTSSGQPSSSIGPTGASTFIFSAASMTSSSFSFQPSATGSIIGNDPGAITSSETGNSWDGLLLETANGQPLDDCALTGAAAGANFGNNMSVLVAQARQQIAEGIAQDGGFQFPANLSSYNSTTPGNSTAADNGITYSNLPDVTNSFQLSAGSDGNFYPAAINAASGSGLFATAGNDIYSADIEGRLMFYYGPEMSNLGVSRFRLADIYSIPQGAKLLSLAPVSDPSHSTTTYVAVDTEGNAFWLVRCAFKQDAAPNKIFLVQDHYTGLQTLQLPQLSYTVTGGEVSQCYNIALGPPSKSSSSTTTM